MRMATRCSRRRLLGREDTDVDALKKLVGLVGFSESKVVVSLWSRSRKMTHESHVLMKKTVS